MKKLFVYFVSIYMLFTLNSFAQEDSQCNPGNVILTPSRTIVMQSNGGKFNTDPMVDLNLMNCPGINDGCIYGYEVNCSQSTIGYDNLPIMLKKSSYWNGATKDWGGSGGRKITGISLGWDFNLSGLSEYECTALREDVQRRGSTIYTLEMNVPVSYRKWGYKTVNYTVTFQLDVSNVVNGDVCSTELPTPLLRSPANNSRNVSDSPELNWNYDSKVSRYQVQLSSDYNFYNLEMDKEVNGCSCSSVPLDNNTTYYWRVKAKSSSKESQWSSVWSFTTKTTTSVGSDNDGARFMHLAIQPNPSSSQIKLSGLVGIKTHIKLINCFGELVMETIADRETLIMDISGLSNGVYYIIAGDKYLARAKFIKVE